MFLRRVTLWNVYSENEETQGEEAYDSEEVSIQPDEGLQPPRPAGFYFARYLLVVYSSFTQLR